MVENSVTEHIDNPICTRHRDCFANKGGRCVCLIKNNFGGNECPFYKNRTDYFNELEWLAKRVNR